MDPQGPHDLDSLIVHLHRLLVTHYDVEELRTLCFQLGIAYDDLPGTTKSGRARELLLFLQRRQRLPELVDRGKRERPEIPWPDLADLPPSPFVNREHELALLHPERLRASHSPYALINAPAGYGKSHLLQHLIATTQTDPVLRQAWHVCYVDMSQSATDQVDHVLQAISGRSSPSQAERRCPSSLSALKRNRETGRFSSDSSSSTLTALT